jgi:uncharacterized protein YndB with AHSA1/START domain
MMSESSEDAIWVRTTASIVIERPPAEVFAFVSDPRNDAEWLGKIRDTRQLTPGPIGVGTRFRQGANFLGAAVEGEWEVVEFVEGVSTRCRSVAGPFRFVRTYACEPAGAATRLTNLVEVSLSGVLAILPRSAADGLLASSAHRALARLKDLLERGSAPQAPPL